jgi:hypothetical protein
MQGCQNTLIQLILRSGNLLLWTPGRVEDLMIVPWLLN